MTELTHAQLELLKIAADLAGKRYSPQTKGRFSNLTKDVMYYTPQNIKAVYDELCKLFQ